MRDFTGTGAIGDTIGGITAPFINILGAILVFLALKAQVQANISIQDQIKSQETDKRHKNESKQLNLYYSSLKNSIDGFKYSTLDRWSLGNGEETELTGSEAVYKLFQDFYCNFHANEDELRCNPKITELISMLEICEQLLTQIITSYVPDKDTLWILTKHQFLYRLFLGISSRFPHDLTPSYCPSCAAEHGLPERIILLLSNINRMIAPSTETNVQANQNLLNQST